MSLLHDIVGYAIDNDIINLDLVYKQFGYRLNYYEGLYNSIEVGLASVEELIVKSNSSYIEAKIIKDMINFLGGLPLIFKVEDYNGWVELPAILVRESNGVLRLFVCKQIGNSFVSYDTLVELEFAINYELEFLPYELELKYFSDLMSYYSMIRSNGELNFRIKTRNLEYIPS